LSRELDKLLSAADSEEKDAAWQAFVRRYSRVLLHTVHSHSHTYDGAMDQYAFVLERLRKDDCRRLRLYLADGRTTFPTWLVVVANRLCVDYARQLYGRQRETKTREDTAPETAIVRQRLVDQIWADVDLGGLQDVYSRDPERRLRESELKEALAGATRDLEPRDRLLLQLKFEEGMSAREIAETMRYSDRGITGPTP
jgi:RNA polymerase sigma factor (sigma-70 family)